MAEPTEITIYPFILERTGIKTLHAINTRGKFCRVLRADEPFKLRLNGGNQFRAELGMHFPELVGGLESIEVASYSDQSAESLTVEIVVSNTKVGFDAIQLTGSVDVSPATMKFIGDLTTDVTLAASTKTTIYGGASNVEYVMVQHIAGTAPVRIVANNDIVLATNSGLYLAPGESFAFPVGTGSLHAISTGTPTLAVTPFLTR